MKEERFGLNSKRKNTLRSLRRKMTLRSTKRKVTLTYMEIESEVLGKKLNLR